MEKNVNITDFNSAESNLLIQELEDVIDMGSVGWCVPDNSSPLGGYWSDTGTQCTPNDPPKVTWKPYS